MGGKTRPTPSWAVSATTPQFDRPDPWWVRALSAILSIALGGVLAGVVLYYLFLWWVSTA